MRKGYGPTGISFAYPFTKFQEDVASGKVFRVELVLNGNCFYPEFDLQANTESELKSLYDKVDSYSMPDHVPTLQIFT